MSYFSEELHRQMLASNKGKGMTVQELVDRSGVSRGQIYRWKNFGQTSISPDQLTAIALSISRDPNQNARLVMAHLLDEKFGPGSELVTVLISDADQLKDSDAPPKTRREKALEYLTKLSITSKSTADLLIQQAVLLGAKLDEVSSGRAAAREIFQAAVAEVHGGAKSPSPPTRPVKYKVRRHLKK